MTDITDRTDLLEEIFPEEEDRSLARLIHKDSEELLSGMAAALAVRKILVQRGITTIEELDKEDLASYMVLLRVAVEGARGSVEPGLESALIDDYIEGKGTDPNPPKPVPAPVGLPLTIDCPNPSCFAGLTVVKNAHGSTLSDPCNACNGKGQMTADSVAATWLKAHLDWVTPENEFVLSLQEGYCAGCCAAKNRYAGQECKNCPGEVLGPWNGA